MPYQRVNPGDSGNSGPTAATTIVNAHSDGLERLEAAFIDVTRYGADKTGASDSTTAIQSALNAVPAAGGTVYFPAGTYRVDNGGLNAPNPTRVMGDGHGDFTNGGGSRIVVTSRTAHALTFAAPGSSIMDIALVRNMSGSTWTTNRATAGSGVRFNDITFGHITRCLISGFWNNIQVVKGHYYNITDSVILNPANCGLYSTTVPVWLDWGVPYISGCTFTKFGDPVNGGYALFWAGGGGIRITNSYFNSRSQPDFNGTATGSFNHLLWFEQNATPGATSVLGISNCGIENALIGGITVKQNASGVPFRFIQISNNEIGYTGNYGIRLESVDLTNIGVMTVTGNTFTSAGAFDGVDYTLDTGVELYGVYGVVVESNAFHGVRLPVETTWCSGVVIGESNSYEAGPGNVPADPFFTHAFTTNQRSYTFTNPVSRTKAAGYQTVFAISPEAGALIRFRFAGTIGGVGPATVLMERSFYYSGGSPTLTTIGSDASAGAAVDVLFDTAAIAGAVLVKVRVPSASAGTTINGTASVEVVGALYALGTTKVD